jgi:hypothetical protein
VSRRSLFLSAQYLTPVVNSCTPVLSSEYDDLRHKLETILTHRKPKYLLVTTVTPSKLKIPNFTSYVDSMLMFILLLDNDTVRKWDALTTFRRNVLLPSSEYKII